MPTSDEDFENYLLSKEQFYAIGPGSIGSYGTRWTIEFNLWRCHAVKIRFHNEPSYVGGTLIAEVMMQNKSVKYYDGPLNQLSAKEYLRLIFIVNTILKWSPKNSLTKV